MNISGIELFDGYAGQMPLEFPKKFKPEQMGFVIGTKSIVLNSSFIGKELGLGGMGGIDLSSIGKLSEVFCPFCQRGKLRLKSVKPVHSSGSNSFGTSHHVGNEYDFDCSEGCGAMFSGEIIWMFVD